jgi:hypothetical protein
MENFVTLTSEIEISQHSAVDPSIGYLYQVRLALLLTLQRLKSDANFLVSVETLDDVGFETIMGDPIALLQTKHHRKSIASLSDYSKDIWKTLRIWFEGNANDLIPSTTSLFLITTAVAPDGTAAYYLRRSTRDVEAAQRALETVASSSSSKENAAAYEIYKSTDLTHRKAILSKIIVVDAAPTITNLDDELRQEIFWAVGKYHHNDFLERLEGWWFRRVLKQL